MFCETRSLESKYERMPGLVVLHPSFSMATVIQGMKMTSVILKRANSKQHPVKMGNNIMTLTSLVLMEND